MPLVSDVRLHYAGAPVWFKQDETLELHEGDQVLCRTERGQEVGLVLRAAHQVSDEEVAALHSPLKPIIRAITPDDYPTLDELDRLSREAMPLFRELAKKHQLDMKPVAVDYLFDRQKAVFYFSSEERVDFRALVRELASNLHVGVDMRQIGVRDETRILGGIAHCGEEFCCVRFNGDFQPVAIRMAKEQNLSLNPTKISGACGRLMCCLRYEFEAYKDFNGRAPKRGATIETPLGPAKVVDFNTPRETIQLKLIEDDKTFVVPLSSMDCPKDPQTGACMRPTSVSMEALRASATGSTAMLLGGLERFDTSTLSDDVADSSKRRQRRTHGGGGVSGAAASSGAGAGAGSDEEQGKGKGKGKGNKRKSTHTQGKQKQDNKAGQAGASGQAGQAGQASTSHRRRRHSHEGGNGNGGAASETVQSATQAQGVQDAAGGKPVQRKQRPGQNSSAVRTANTHAEGRTGGSSGAGDNGAKGGAGAKGGGQHRRGRGGNGSAGGAGKVHETGTAQKAQPAQGAQSARTASASTGDGRKPRRKTAQRLAGQDGGAQKGQQQ